MWPLKGPVFIYLCDLKWPRTVRGWEWPHTLHYRPGNWGRFFPSCRHPLVPGVEAGGCPSLKRNLREGPQEPCPHSPRGLSPPLLLCASPAGRFLLPPPGRWAKPSGPQWPWAQSEGWCADPLQPCLLWAALSWSGHRMMSCVLVPGNGRLCPMAISGHEIQPVSNRTWAKTRKENRREAVFLLWKQVLRTF